MGLVDLPNELLEHIFEANGRNSTTTIMCSCVIHREHVAMFNLMASRIQFAMRVCMYYKKLRGFIELGLTRTFNLLPLRGVVIRNGLPEIITKNKTTDCVYYAPHIPNSPCRHCLKYESDHLLPGYLVETDYCDFIGEQYQTARPI